MSRLVPRFNGGSTEAMESLFRFVSTANQPGHGFGLTVWPFLPKLHACHVPILAPLIKHAKELDGTSTEHV